MAATSAAAAARPHRVTPAGAASPHELRSALPGPRAAVPPDVVRLLAAAHEALQDSAVLGTPNEQYAAAHLSALRTAAAVLAARGRPDASRGRARIRSAWEILPAVAPELAEWGALFAAGAARRARAEAGIQGAAGRRDADDLRREAEHFLGVVETLLVPEPTLPGPRECPPGQEPEAVAARAVQSGEPGPRPRQ